MDHRGVVASLALGASGVQMGTAFIPCSESGSHPSHKAAILHSSDKSTVLTRTFSGKYARGIHNRFMSEMTQHQAVIPPYPIQNALTKDIRAAAGKQNKTEFMSMWAGQAAALSRPLSAGDFIAHLREQTLKQLSSFASTYSNPS